LARDTPQTVWDIDPARRHPTRWTAANDPDCRCPVPCGRV